jgi:thiol-disulfide isomerase/thioredoxin
MDPDLAKKFHDSGASDELIEALQKAGKEAKSPAAPGGQVTPPVPNPEASPPAPEAQTGHPAASTEEKIHEVLKEVESTPLDASGESLWAPMFRFTNLEGQKMDLRDFRGKVLLLDFWATWCRSCQSQIPGLVLLQDRYRDQGFEIVGIAIHDQVRAVRDLCKEYHVNYPVTMGDSALRQLYGGISGVPTTFLIGRDGRIHCKVEGAANVESLERRIQPLLAAGQPGPGSQSSPSGPTASTLGAPATPAAAPVAAPGATAAGTQPGSASTAAAKGGVALGDPSPDQIQSVIRQFAAKEKLFKTARDNYTYHQINKVQELGPDDEVEGVYEQQWDILYDDNGNRIERVTYAPTDTLKRIILTKEDLESFRSIQPFVLTSDELPEYEITYLGHVKVDEITAYVFSVRPKEIKKGRVYFKGTIWVDDRDLQIVKSEGKTVPELKTKKGENLFPRFSTYREQIDGKYWFPTYTIADDTLYFESGPVHVKQVIRYTDYKQFKSKVRILSATPTDQQNTPKAPAPPKKP